MSSPIFSLAASDQTMDEIMNLRDETDQRIDEMAGELAKAGIPFRRKAPLARLTTIGVGGPADLLVRPGTAKAMATTLALVRELELPSKVLGAGSNLLVSDAGVRGVVVHTGAMKEMEIREDGRVEAGAGCHFPTLVRALVARGLRGLEGGVGIPGSLGGVVTMNAGTYQFSIGPLLEKVTVASAEGARDLKRGVFEFRYRSSTFSEGLGSGFGDVLAVAGAEMVLEQDDPRSVKEDMNSQMRYRKETQPVGVKSAGCIFKNPDGDSAGRLIDSLGLKGFQLGGARVSDVHANFIVHDGSASAADVAALIDAVRERVLQETAIDLEQEVMAWN